MRHLISIITFVIITTTATYAQKVTRDSNKNVFIDARNVKTGVSETSLNKPHNENSATNAIFIRFQVDATDSPSANWTSATATCVAKGSNWRLPTQKELQLIWTLKDDLVEAGVNDFEILNYWSSTEFSGFPKNAWYVYFNIGNTASFAQTYKYSVRCVREVAE